MIADNPFLADETVRRIVIDNYIVYYKAIESEDKESQNSFLTIPTSTISNKYSAIFRRLEKY